MLGKAIKEEDVKANRTKISKWLVLPLVAGLMMLGTAGAVQAAGELGKKIDKSNVQEYKDLLIPALYRAVERGDFILQTAPKVNYEYKHRAEYMAAGEKNEGKFDVNAMGDLIEKGSAPTLSASNANKDANAKHVGKIPLYNIYGRPFPHIDLNDPNAGIKVMYNFQWNKYRIMGEHYQNKITWVDSKKGEHRYIWSNSLELMMQGRPPGQEITDNPNGWLKLSLGLNMEPFDMYGTNQLIYDFQDERDITTYAYVPSIRRVRQSSGVVRSDPYFGSDAWQDLGFLWDGKNRWMSWKLAGVKTILVPFSQVDLRHTTEEPDGTYHFNYAPIKFGFQTPGWTGITWAPTNLVWVPRKVYVIEQRPKDPYYAWGLHINYVDVEAENIWMKEIHEKTGNFRTWSIAAYTKTVTPSGQDNVGMRDVQVTIDEKARHATIGWVQNAEGDNSAMFMPVTRLSPKIFTKEYMMRMSK